jgi:hypothetical protein
VTLGDQLNFGLEPFSDNPKMLFDLVYSLLVHAFLPTAQRLSDPDRQLEMKG